MVESKPFHHAKMQELVKIFWIINNSKYDQLRLLKGCENLADLEATPKDVVFIEKMAKCFGVEDENLFKDSEPDAKQLKKTYLEIRKRSRTLTSNG